MKQENDNHLNQVQKRNLKEIIDKLSDILTQDEYHNILKIFDAALDREIKALIKTLSW